MAGEQDIFSLGLDISTFDSQKKTILTEFIGLFNDLSKFDGKIINPVLGDGIVKFNTSLQESAQLIDSMSVKISSLNSTQTVYQSTATSSAKTTTEMSLAVKEHSKLLDQNAVIEAKLNALTSESAKENAALKLQLSETTKALLDQAKAENSVYQVRERNKVQAAEYRQEQRRVVEVLRALAVQQDNDIKDKIIEDKITKDLNNDYLILNRTLKQQADLYRQIAAAKGVKSPEAKQALGEYAATAGIVGTIDKQLSGATGKTKLFNGALSSAFASLRTIAYILPGIGIAGIFNLAFEAIGNAAEALGLFTSSIEKYLNYQIQVNKSLEEQIELNEKLISLARELNKLPNGRLSANDEVSINESRGFDRSIILFQRKQLAEKDLQQSAANILGRGDSPESLQTTLNRRLSVLNDYAARVKKIDDILDAKINPKASVTSGSKKYDITSKGSAGIVEGVFNPSKSTLEKLKENLNIKSKIEEDNYNAEKILLDKYQASQLDYFKANAEYQKFYEDEERKTKLAFARESVSITIDRNEKILHEDISSEIARADALEEIKKQQKKQNKAELDNVLDNLSSTPRDIDIANNKYNTDNDKADLKYTIDLANLREDYRQRRLKATTEINKNEVETTAIANEKIFKDDNHTLDERLKAYLIYIQKKQTLQNLEYAKDIDTLSLKADDPTARLQVKALGSNRDMQNANIQADSEKEVYDIVYTSLQKQLKAVMEFNHSLTDENKKSYSLDLVNLNKSFEDKTIGYRRYVNERIRIDEKYRVNVLDENIKDDKDDLLRLNNLLKEEEIKKSKSNSELEDATINKSYVDTSGDGNKLAADEDFKSALGKNKAIEQSIIDTKKNIDNVSKKLGDDELEREKRKYDQLIAYQKEYAENTKLIEEGIFNLVKTSLDAQFQVREDNSAKIKQTIDEGYLSEQDAIEKSSLSNKDKAALDIQIAEQKREYDKQADIDQKRMKHDQAVLDRDLSIAHILWNTEESVSAALTIAPPIGEAIAFQRGLLGAIEIATVLATPIPSYAEGTDFHPGGIARYGEKNPEIVKKPGEKPFIALTETISYLPKGTEVIPIDDSYDLSKTEFKDTGWEQTRWLANQIKKNNKGVINRINIISDNKFNMFRSRILKN